MDWAIRDLEMLTCHRTIELYTELRFNNKPREKILGKQQKKSESNKQRYDSN